MSITTLKSPVGHPTESLTRVRAGSIHPRTLSLSGPGTGAGLGKAFAQLGGPVALLARRKESLDGVKKMIETQVQGGEAESFVCDASSAESIKSAISGQ